MVGSQRWMRWAWPVPPTLAAVWLLVNSDGVDRRCPDYKTSLPPHPEQCLPTLWPGITGADPLLIGASWLMVAVIIYTVIGVAAWGWRRRGTR